MEVHHLFPRNLGGTDTLDNAATMCAKCHDMIHTLKLIRLPTDSHIEITYSKILCVPKVIQNNPT